jgi:hypothetical protein
VWIVQSVCAHVWMLHTVVLLLTVHLEWRDDSHHCLRIIQQINIRHPESDFQLYTSHVNFDQYGKTKYNVWREIQTPMYVRIFIYSIPPPKAESCRTQTYVKINLYMYKILQLISLVLFAVFTFISPSLTPCTVILLRKNSNEIGNMLLVWNSLVVI